MSMPGTGAAAAAAVLGAWIATPLLAMGRHGTLDERHAGELRRRPVLAGTGEEPGTGEEHGRRRPSYDR